MSGKSPRVKKDLPQKAVITEEIQNKIVAHVNNTNTKLGMQLYKGCDLKIYRKNYEKDTVRREWTLKSTHVKKRFLVIFTLRDRVLQTVIETAVQPITEYYADSNSFGFRQKKTALDAISLLIGCLEHQKKSKMGGKIPFVKVSKKKYYSFNKRRFRKKKALKIKNVSKRKREYFYDYYICKDDVTIKYKEVEEKPSVFFSNCYIINVMIKKCFDKSDYQMIIEKHPLCIKYRFFLKAWLKVPVHNTIRWRDKILLKEKSKAGVSTSSIVGQSVINCVLNGLEETI